MRKTVRTDKWQLRPSADDLLALSSTVSLFRSYCRALIGVVYTHWDTLGSLDSDRVVPAVERLIHSTKKNPGARYAWYFARRFYKFPSYYRRSAIMFCMGQVSSFVSRYRTWQSGDRKRRDALPPRLNADTGCYPALYAGQCIKYQKDAVEIKAFKNGDWVWITIPVAKRGLRHQVESNSQQSPHLIVRDDQATLSVPFWCKPQSRTETNSVVSVDLGINITATVAVVSLDGTVKHREFIHMGRDIDQRDQRLQRISSKASLTMGKGGKLHKGFSQALYRKSRNINTQISRTVARRIVQIALQHNVKTIVFEHLKGWRPTAGKRGSTLRQRFHGWLHRGIVNQTEQIWKEQGGKVAFINPRGTSSYAYDGSGKLRRDSDNRANATFSTGKRYNCDLNAAYNIGARYWLKLKPVAETTLGNQGTKVIPTSARIPPYLVWTMD
ncbi:IS200/IS605 family accessory protein TnpB-related protein [Leptolyngbya sp. AN03gr2]|uniref:IS200/IS605 family accessory protein TnpB-related protein n=1 Tax=unclassified Leptolyngbya TaxID=2650499 RepID=UPI003D312C20